MNKVNNVKIDTIPKNSYLFYSVIYDIKSLLKHI